MNHVIEVGGPPTIDRSLNCLRMGGSVHVIGFVAGRVVQKSEDQATLPLKVMSKAANLRGVLVGSVTQYVP